MTPGVELIFKISPALRIFFGQLIDQDAAPDRDDIGDIFLFEAVMLGIDRALPRPCSSDLIFFQLSAHRV